MTAVFILFFIIALLHGLYRWPLSLMFTLWAITLILAYAYDEISKTQGITLMSITLILFAVGVYRPLRRFLISNRLIQLFNNREAAGWKKFLRIDSGWMTTEFENRLFNGDPDFSSPLGDENTPVSQAQLKRWLQSVDWPALQNTHQPASRQAALPALASFTVAQKHGGKGLKDGPFAQLLQHLASSDPVLAAVTALLNLDSVTRLLQSHGTIGQQNDHLPAIAAAHKMPFLNTTSLYELFEKGQSSIEGRVEIETRKNQQIHGIRISFSNIIMLGTPASTLFYLAINVTDVTHILGTRRKLGTALCLFDAAQDDIQITAGNTVYSGLMTYYSCSAKNIFIPLDQIIGGFKAVNKGIERLYAMQATAARCWPAAVSLPIHRTASLTSWHFAQLKKQNGRPLMTFKMVRKKLLQQFSQNLIVHLISQFMSSGANPSTTSYSMILWKNTILNNTINQLNLLRTILGSHAHNINAESKLGSFYKVVHLSMELDGDSHEINQLPLMKKVALAAHPYYAREIQLLVQEPLDEKAMDRVLFKHMGLVLHQLVKIWLHAFKTSWLGKLFFKRSKYQNMIRRMSSTFAFIADLSLIKWSVKNESNTEFTGYLAQTNQQLLLLMALVGFYRQKDDDEAMKFITKQSMYNAFFETQNTLKYAINSAFSRPTALLLKAAIFPFGKPFNRASFSSRNEIKISQDNWLFHDSAPNSDLLRHILLTSEKLNQAHSVETAVSNATGTPVTTENFQVLIDRALAAGIVSVEQAEKLREAYQDILNLQLINHFGNQHEK